MGAEALSRASRHGRSTAIPGKRGMGPAQGGEGGPGSHATKAGRATRTEHPE